MTDRNIGCESLCVSAKKSLQELLYVLRIIQNIFQVSPTKNRKEVQMFLLLRSVRKVCSCLCCEKANFIVIYEFKFGKTWKTWPYQLKKLLYITYKEPVGFWNVVAKKTNSSYQWRKNSYFKKIVHLQSTPNLALKRLGRVNLTPPPLPPCYFSKNVSSSENLKPYFLWLLILSQVTFFLKISLEFLKSFRRYKGFLRQY